jgi:hypothetical protein
VSKLEGSGQRAALIRAGEMMNSYREGQLEMNSSGRFELEDHEFTCGDPIEIQFDRQWVRGRIEHVQGHGYMFCLWDRNIKIKAGDPARIQVG